MARLSVRGLCLAVLFLGTSACTAIVGGKLNKLPEGSDAGSVSCTPMTPCDDGNPCKGPDECSPDGHCVGGVVPIGDGTPCDRDGNAGTMDICIAGGCVLSPCGDRIVQSGPPSFEECDDGANSNDNDGCRSDCKFTCTRIEDCQDGNVCDGAEVCSAGLPGNRMCRESDALPPDGTPCTKPDSNPGMCFAAMCR